MDNNSINNDNEMTVEMNVSIDDKSNHDSKFKIYIVNYDINWIFNSLCCLNQFPEFQRNMSCVNNKEYIKWTFHRLDIGNVLSCKIIDNNNDNYCIEVIFDNLYNTKTSENFYNNLINNYETQLVHDEPKSWIIYI